jgi:predicted RNA polymerase sigma factor
LPAQPVPPPEEQDHSSTAYLVLTLRLSEEAADVPVIEVIRAVRTAAVALAASRGSEPGLADVERVARRHLGLVG